MSLILAIFRAIVDAFSLWKSERALYNSPEMVKNKLAQQNQAAKDAVNRANSVLADPAATPEEHKKALDELRRAMS